MLQQSCRYFYAEGLSSIHNFLVELTTTGLYDLNGNHMYAHLNNSNTYNVYKNNTE